MPGPSPSPIPAVSLDTPNLGALVEAMPRSVVDTLPFGAIRVDRHHRITYFSQNEAAKSGYGNRPAIGLDFFTELAPCMQTESLRLEVDRAWERGTLDISFFHTGDFNDPQRVVRVRIVSLHGGGWIFIERP